jgi:hypothetical protein
MTSAAPTDDRPLPLAGVRVLELGALIAGPYASALLAQFGAEVVKVEPPGDLGEPAAGGGATDGDRKLARNSSLRRRARCAQTANGMDRCEAAGSTNAADTNKARRACEKSTCTCIRRSKWRESCVATVERAKRAVHPASWRPGAVLRSRNRMHSPGKN